jgi:hypothetical protein
MKQTAEIIFISKVREIFFKKGRPLYCDRLLNAITEEFVAIYIKQPGFGRGSSN